MTVRALAEHLGITPHTGEEGLDEPVAGAYMCDLLSWVIGRAAQGAAWITIMSNQNVAAVALLAEISCVLLAENVQPDEALLAAAEKQGLPLFTVDMPSYEIAKRLGNLGV